MKLYTDGNYQYLRIGELPEDEQAPFIKWLEGQTMPLPGIPEVYVDDKSGWSEWIMDAAFPWDYDRWKAGRQVID